MSDTESQTIDSSIDTGDGAADSSPRRCAPGWVIWLLIVLATVVGMGATLNTWVDRQALDTDEWVATTDEMLADDEIREALSVYLTSQLFENVDVANELESLLPGPAAQLAGPLAATLESNAVNLVNRLLATDQFATLWSSVNRAAHTAFVTLANGDDVGSLSTADGSFVVDMRELLVNLADRLGLPGAAVERIPEDAGQLVVFESEEIDALQQFVRFVDVLSVFLFVLVVVLYGAAVYLARDRRASLRNVGIAMFVGSLLLLVIQRVTVNLSVGELARAESSEDAVASLVSIATGLLNELAWAWLSIGVLIALFAVLVGPTRAAVATRKILAPVMINPIGAWGLSLGALGLYVLLGPGFSIQRWLPLIVLGALFVTAVEMLRRQISREHAAAPAPAES